MPETPEIPDFIAAAIRAQGKTTPEEVEEKMAELDPDTLLGVVDPEPVEPEQERLDLGIGHVGTGEPE